jgi:hypothetical protein
MLGQDSPSSQRGPEVESAKTTSVAALRGFTPVRPRPGIVFVPAGSAAPRGDLWAAKQKAQPIYYGISFDVAQVALQKPPFDVPLRKATALSR